MKHLSILAALTLSACTNAQLTSLQEKHRAYVCSHQQAVTLAANAVIKNAETIKNPNVRAAAIAIATADLAIVATCE